MGSHRHFNLTVLLMLTTTIAASTARANPSVDEAQREFDSADAQVACAEQNLDTARAAIDAAQARQRDAQAALDETLQSIDKLHQSAADVDAILLQIRTAMTQINRDLVVRRSALEAAVLAAGDAHARFASSMVAALEVFASEPDSIAWLGVILEAEAEYADSLVRAGVFDRAADVRAAGDALAAAQADFDGFQKNAIEVCDAIAHAEADARFLSDAVQTAVDDTFAAESAASGALAALDSAQRDREAAAARLRDAVALCEAPPVYDGGLTIVTPVYPTHERDHDRHEDHRKHNDAARDAARDEHRQREQRDADRKTEQERREAEWRKARDSHADADAKPAPPKTPVVKPGPPPTPPSRSDVQGRLEQEQKKLEEQRRIADRKRDEMGRQVDQQRARDAAGAEKRRQEQQRVADRQRQEMAKQAEQQRVRDAAEADKSRQEQQRRTDAARRDAESRQREEDRKRDDAQARQPAAGSKIVR